MADNLLKINTYEIRVVAPSEYDRDKTEAEMETVFDSIDEAVAKVESALANLLAEIDPALIVTIE